MGTGWPMANGLWLIQYLAQGSNKDALKWICLKHIQQKLLQAVKSSYPIERTLRLKEAAEGRSLLIY